MSLNVYECIKSIKRRIEEEPTAPVSLLYDQQVKKFRRENGTAAEVPVFDRIKSSLYEYRSSKQPPIPKTLASIDVPYSLTRTLMGQNFLFCNNNLLSILGFASPMAIQLLGANPHWSSDGTFRTAPKLFYQSYSIHIWDDYTMKPVVYAALLNKNINTYDIFLSELTAYAKTNGISLLPKSILIDFEMAAYNAFSKNFPTSKIKGCQFHFGQNIWRQIKKKGLITHSKGVEARRQIANILMLPLLPPQEINTAFGDIIEEISNVHQNFLKLTDYILRTYIEDALFSPSFWNLFDLIGIRPKTNNHVEGYHGQLNSHCQTHPNLWAWIRYIQESEESTMVRVEQEQAQQRSARRRRATSVTNENILIKAKQEYLDGVLNLSGYQKRLRSFYYRYINVFDTTDKDDLDYEPPQN
ncbi:unnamed protein product [Rotaria sp. Silwood1]|nr:unnamed protein product [Rotaria sp. Silwood1]